MSQNRRRKSSLRRERCRQNQRFSTRPAHLNCRGSCRRMNAMICSPAETIMVNGISMKSLCLICVVQRKLIHEEDNHLCSSPWSVCFQTISFLRLQTTKCPSGPGELQTLQVQDVRHALGFLQFCSTHVIENTRTRYRYVFPHAIPASKMKAQLMAFQMLPARFQEILTLETGSTTVQCRTH